MSSSRVSHLLSLSFFVPFPADTRYAVAPEHKRRLENAARTYVDCLLPTWREAMLVPCCRPYFLSLFSHDSVFGAAYLTCKQFLRHKIWMMSPSFLRNHNVPVYKVRGLRDGLL